MSKRIGLIGIGNMGYGIALNLIKAGYFLHIIKHRNSQKVQKLQEMGARLEYSIIDIALKCETILLCLPNSRVVEEVLLGEDGVINHLRNNAVIIDCSTSRPESTKILGDYLKDKQVTLLDAPLTKGPEEAIKGKLNVMVGGDYTIFEKNKDILRCFSENIFYIGKLGEAHKLKLFNNFISMGFTGIVITSLALAKLNNIDVNKLDEIMSKGSNYISTLPSMINWINNKEESILQFSINNAYKDLKYFKEIINEEEQSKLFIVDEFILFFQQAIERGLGNEMLPRLYDFYSKHKKF
ncbi:NAD(P)-dependent oxidoreductase [Bacillus subtilis]|nr:MULTISPECIES: NAD(P)-dependent oxidoreductase [Bacillus]MBU8842182.1 NAD(P)-dependent oxidoreductase [Alkalicoccobacillus gibsonii]HCJ7961477.1 NAD(P)-dependent oxidoreductase [Klebsiella pneumoniae]ADV93493.1 6-phosphogluconate dehydrogenase, NAD-binding protein [Bacillus subtilis BSn5]AKE24474.1 6-phosphogluconate dehydrogenase, NAD-binding protein [Bacillus sp. LM 4-2]AXP49222.1 NAD(P)-dependent oxidoreductase [Bacillus subtilis subsp. subtilis]